MPETTPATSATSPTTPIASGEGAEVTLSAEQLRAGVRRVAVEQVRIRTRVVTETRTLTVEVRREELVVERVPLQGGSMASPSEDRGDPGQPVLSLVLRQEVPEVTTRLVPVEEVRVYRDRVDGTEQVTAILAHEELDVTGGAPASR